MLDLIWDLDDELGGNVEHIRQHGLTKDDVAHALENAIRREDSRSSERPLILGPALDGRLIVVIFEEIDSITVYPVTAFEPEDL